MKKYIRRLLWHVSEKLNIGEINRKTDFIHRLLTEDYLAKHLHGSSDYKDSKNLNRYEYDIYSQSGEDGILEEIFERVGVTSKFFVEFGVSNGLENNTTFLLLKEWKGLWLEGSESFVKEINDSFKQPISTGQLQVENVFITRENIKEHFKGGKVPKEFDLLSIDIDGNDYHVWKSIDNYSPRVVVIECNPFFGPKIKCVQKYGSNYVWARDSFFGASVKSLELLGKSKGYTLIATNFMGNNAFFVRNDLVGDKFLPPFTSESKYHSNKIFLLKEYRYKKSFRSFDSV